MQVNDPIGASDEKMIAALSPEIVRAFEWIAPEDIVFVAAWRLQAESVPAPENRAVET